MYLLIFMCECSHTLVYSLPVCPIGQVLCHHSAEAFHFYFARNLKHVRREWRICVFSFCTNTGKEGRTTDYCKYKLLNIWRSFADCRFQVTYSKNWKDRQFPISGLESITTPTKNSLVSRMIEFSNDTSQYKRPVYPGPEWYTEFYLARKSHTFSRFEEDVLLRHYRQAAMFPTYRLWNAARLLWKTLEKILYKLVHFQSKSITKRHTHISMSLDLAIVFILLGLWDSRDSSSSNSEMKRHRKTGKENHKPTLSGKEKHSRITKLELTPIFVFCKLFS